MAIDTTLLTDFSWADIKIACKQSVMTGLLSGVVLTINGRTIGRYTADQIKTIYAWACEMEAIESADAFGGTALAQYGDRV